MMLSNSTYNMTPRNAQCRSDHGMEKWSMFSESLGTIAKRTEPISSKSIDFEPLFSKPVVSKHEDSKHSPEKLDTTSSEIDLSFLFPASDSASDPLEPTPIAPTRMRIVENIGVEDTSLLLDEVDQDASYEEYLFPLLGRADPDTVLSRPCPSSNEPLTSVESSFSRSSLISLDSRARETHKEKWSQRFQDLVSFRERFGHCLVPLDWPYNPSLAHWVKRQRCQYKAKIEGNHSTLTEERMKMLEDMGFIWDSHKDTWEVRLHELAAFQASHGHCNVPSKYEKNPQLSIWVKCQRRQFKLFMEGKRSNMTNERIEKLTDIGFVWSPRERKQKSKDILRLLQNSAC